MIDIGGRILSLENFSEILFKEKGVKLDQAALEKVDTNYHFLKDFSMGKLIYGINTGFGPMAQYKVSEENRVQLQFNLIRSHSSGGGNLMSPFLAKAVVVARLNSLMQAYSGIHTSLVELLRDLINENITPCIYEHGGVGASGDLIQLAHLGLTLIGEGKVGFEGETQPAADVLKKCEIKPLSMY